MALMRAIAVQDTAHRRADSDDGLHSSPRRRSMGLGPARDLLGVDAVQANMQPRDDDRVTVKHPRNALDHLLCCGWGDRMSKRRDRQKQSRYNMTPKGSGSAATVGQA